MLIHVNNIKSNAIQIKVKKFNFKYNYSTNQMDDNEIQFNIKQL